MSTSAEEPTKELKAFKCFIDGERHCTYQCMAYDQKKNGCKLVNSATSFSSNFRTMTRWLAHHDPPKV